MTTEKQDEASSFKSDMEALTRKHSAHVDVSTIMEIAAIMEQAAVVAVTRGLSVDEFCKIANVRYETVQIEYTDGLDAYDDLMSDKKTDE